MRGTPGLLVNQILSVFSHKHIQIYKNNLISANLCSKKADLFPDRPNHHPHNHTLYVISIIGVK
jgi:hypothetical protein